MLALGTTTHAWAQDAAPVLDAPVASAPAAVPDTAPAPTIVLPTTTPAPAAPAASAPEMVSQPMVQAAPAVPPVAAEAERPAPRAAAQRAAPVARVASPQPAAAPVAATAAAKAVPAAETNPPTAPLPLAPAAETPPPVTNAAREGAPAAPVATDGDASPSTAAEIAAALLALGIGAGAYFAVRSRRRRHLAEEQEVHVIAEQPLEPAYAAPQQAVMTPEIERETPLPAFATTEDMTGEGMAGAATVREAEPVHEPGVPHLKTPILQTSDMLDGPVPQNRADRDALLERMVAAEPDAENPFTSRKGRLRRARIMLQSREIEQKQAEAGQPFDWRTYKPSTSNPAPATPPRVTA